MSKYIAVSSMDGITLKFAEPVVEVKISQAELQTMLTAVNLEYLASYDPDKPVMPTLLITPAFHAEGVQ